MSNVELHIVAKKEEDLLFELIQLLIKYFSEKKLKFKIRPSSKSKSFYIKIHSKTYLKLT